MRSRFRPSRRPDALLVAALLLTTSPIAGCSSGGAAATTTTGHQHAHEATLVLGQPDHPIAGPQGNTPQFVVECDFSHAASDDPIVHPGKPGASHLHDFFGNTTTDAFSTYETLEAGTSTCEQQLDRASYWAPALLRDGQPIDPVKSTAYYRPGIGVDPTTVQPYPAGLMMVAGSAAATEPQPVSIVAWSCGTGIERAATPPTCPDGRDLRLLVTFPDCWDGANLDSEAHVGHVAYSSGGQCPAGFPVPVPQLQFSVEYPVTGPTDGLLLASGPIITGHADFFNAWDPAKLATEVTSCLHREVVCGVTSGRKTG